MGARVFHLALNASNPAGIIYPSVRHNSEQRCHKLCLNGNTLLQEPSFLRTPETAAKTSR
jgi:hypothetical protein